MLESGTFYNTFETYAHDLKSKNLFNLLTIVNKQEKKKKREKKIVEKRILFALILSIHNSKQKGFPSIKDHFHWNGHLLQNIDEP